MIPGLADGTCTATKKKWGGGGVKLQNVTVEKARGTSVNKCCFRK